MYTAILVLFLAVIPVPVSAETLGEAEHEESSGRFSVSIYQDNDAGWQQQYKRTDRYYTHGIGVSITHTPLWAEGLADILPSNRYAGNSSTPSPTPPSDSDRKGGKTGRTGASYIIAHKMFTPENLSESELLPDDRPYAGYLYFGSAWQHAGANFLHHIQIDIGLVGPITRASFLQKRIHDNYGGGIPQGWKHQLSNEPTVQLWLQQKWRYSFPIYSTANATAGIGFQVIPGARVGMGTVHRRFEADGIVRLGVNLPDDFGPASLSDPRSAIAIAHHVFGSYLFFRLTGSMVAHNLLVEGNTFESSHGLDSRPMTAKSQAGITLSMKLGRIFCEASYSYTVETPEFYGQKENHMYASANLSFSLPCKR